MRGMLESERSDDDDMEAPIYVFDDSENGRWIKEEAVLDSGAVECATFESGGDTRVKKWRDVDVCRRERNQERRQSNNPLDDKIRCLEERCVQGSSSVPSTYQCRTVARNEARCDYSQRIIRASST